MKHNHEQVEAFIKQALQACDYDSAFSETKYYLNAALQALSKVSKKRGRYAATQKAIEAGKKKQQEWWDMLKKNAAENFDLGWLDDEE